VPVRRITIVNLTTQFPDQIPYAQPPGPRAVADGVDRQFVNGKNHIGGPALRLARPAGLGQHFRAERMKRARIKVLVKFRCHVTSILGGHHRSLPWFDGRRVRKTACSSDGLGIECPGGLYPVARWQTPSGRVSASRPSARVRSRLLNPRGARASLRPEVCTGMSPTCTTGQPACVAAVSMA
jgi:hypothetical protein